MILLLIDIVPVVIIGKFFSIKLAPTFTFKNNNLENQENPESSNSEMTVTTEVVETVKKPIKHKLVTTISIGM
jgi:hypothetical protein